MLNFRCLLIIPFMVFFVACGGGGGGGVSNGNNTTPSNSNSSLGVKEEITTVISDSCKALTNSAELLTCEARLFLDLLSTSQKQSIILDFNKQNATEYWSNLPISFAQRRGLSLSSFSSDIKNSAENLINLALSSQGQDTLAGIRAAEDYLSGIQSSNYQKDFYNISFLNEPSNANAWLFVFTGHHYSFTLSIDSTVKSMTPNFVGIEPVSWVAANTTYDPMKARHDALKAMLTALDSTQLANAKLSQAYDNLLVGPQEEGRYPSSSEGLLVQTLSDSQKQLVKTAIKTYSDDSVNNDLSTVYTSDIQLDQTYISWASYSDLETRGSYVRIDGPRVWIEFSIQGGVLIRNRNHYHSIWRDKLLDYGGNFAL